MEHDSGRAEARKRNDEGRCLQLMCDGAEEMRGFDAAFWADNLI